MAGISLRLLSTITTALLAGMLLINVVLLAFWRQDVLQREMQHDRFVLSILKKEVRNASRDSISLSTFTSFFTDYYSKDKPAMISVCYTGSDPVFIPNIIDDQAEILARYMAKVLATGHASVHVSGSLLSALFTGRMTLLRVESVRSHGKNMAVVGVVRTLSSFTFGLRKAEKTILIYIALNVFFLGGLVLLRIRSLVTVPLQRLIYIAGQYREEGVFPLSSGRTGGEFSLLASNLNRMIATIDNDKKELEKTVTRLEDVNKQLKEHQSEMIRAEKLASVGRIAAGLAHEIGNPIAVVQGYLDLLRSRNLPYSELVDFVDRSEKELQRVAELIRQLLNFSRMTDQNVHKLSLHELLRDFLAMMEGQVCMRDIEIITKFNAENDIVQGDPEQLRQVFLNCLFNALDAMASAQQKFIIIETQCTLTEDLIGGEVARFQMSITDSGMGITEEDLGKVFDAFFTTKEPGKGTGLGLFVSYNIINKHGGQIWLESQKGQGAKVFVELPIARN